MQFKDYYQILGLDKTAGADDIKKAYRKLARKYHPDVSKEPDAAQRIIEINEANAVLSDPEKRAAYDELGRQAHGQGEREFRPPPNWDAGFEFSDAGGDGADYSDFFEELFGRSARTHRAQGHGAGPRGRHASMRGSDHHAKIELDLLDAYEGQDFARIIRQVTLDTGEAIWAWIYALADTDAADRLGQLRTGAASGVGAAPRAERSVEPGHDRLRMAGGDTGRVHPRRPAGARAGGRLLPHRGDATRVLRAPRRRAR